MTTPSDTPRTDANEVLRPNHEGQGVGWVHATFARELEREVNRLKKELAETEITLESWQYAAQYPDG